MNKEQKRALEAAGWVSGDAEDFLDLTPEERRLVELRVAVIRGIRDRRKQQKLSQGELAKRMKTTQPRIARLEAGASEVSLDFMFKGYFALGGSVKDLRIAL
jgi:ribosome-binding protein aMBF1 (putative translation factor)